MKYIHVDTSNVPKLVDAELISHIEDRIQDECLVHLLRQSEEDVAGAVSYVFKKTTGSDLSAASTTVEIKKEKLTPTLFTQAEVKV